MRFFVIGLLTVFGMMSSVNAIDVEALKKAVIYDLPRSEYQKTFGYDFQPELTDEELNEILTYRFDADTVKVLAILVDWTNRPHTYSKETMDSMLFSRGVYPLGSMADYYDEVSYGKIVIDGEVTEWQTSGAYGGSFDFEALLPVLDPIIDFSQYDGNNDGVADAVIFLRSGNGQEDSHDTYDIWSYAFIYSMGYGPGPFDGVMISRWNTSPETRPLRIEWDPTQFSGWDTLNDIRVFSHETAHNLGLPDLYDYDSKLDVSTYSTPGDDNDHPVNDWCIMGYGGYGIFSLGAGVSHLCGWSKSKLGFVEPIVLQGPAQDIVLNAIEVTDQNSLYRLPINNSESEYFLLEYRNSQSSAMFDHDNSDYSCFFFPDLAYGAELLDRGLIITHVDDSAAYWWSINDGTPTFDHYAVAVEDAGYNPTKDETYNPLGHVTDTALWWYPWETQLGAAWSSEQPDQFEFGPTSIPNSDGYFGPSGIIVRVDSIVGDQLYANVTVPSADSDGDGIFDLLDNCPGVSNPNQTNSDTDGFGDSCDNCILVGNPDQIDRDNDQNGDVCDSTIIAWDTISTDVTKLMVSSIGTAGFDANQEMGGANLDFTTSGECDYDATAYLRNASPVVFYDDSIVDYSFEWVHKFRFSDEMATTGSKYSEALFDRYESAIVLSSDSSIALKRTWWAPKNVAGCTYLVQRLTAYSFDGGTHQIAGFGELMDWRLPIFVQGAVYEGYFQGAEQMIYATMDNPYPWISCLENRRRWFGQKFITVLNSNEACLPGQDRLLYGARLVDEATAPIYLPSFDPSDLYSELASSGYDMPVGAAEVFSTMIYAGNVTLGGGDTLSAYSVVAVVFNGTATDIQQALISGETWLRANLLESCSCCKGIRGNINGDVGEVMDISDLTYLVSYMFKSGTPPPCMDEADIDGITPINIADLTYLVSYMFKSGPAPANCP